MGIPGRTRSWVTILVLVLLTGGAAASSIATTPPRSTAAVQRPNYKHGSLSDSQPSVTTSTILATSTTTTTAVAGSGGPLRDPTALAVSPSGDLYVVDNSLHQIFVHLPSGQFQVVAGNGTEGFSGDGAQQQRPSFRTCPTSPSPQGVSLYLADGPRVRLVNQDGVISTIVGNGDTPATVGNGTPALSAALASPVSISFGPGGDLYVGTRLQMAIQGQLLRLEENGTLTVVTAIVTSGDGPKGPINDFGSMAIDAEGDVIVGSTFDGWSVYEITPQGHATYLGYARRSGGDTTVVQAGPNGLIEVDDGPRIDQVQNGSLVAAYNFENTQGIKDFEFVSDFAIGPNGTLYADNLNGAFDPYQQIVQVANGHATSLWQGPTGPMMSHSVGHRPGIARYTGISCGRVLSGPVRAEASTVFGRS